MKTLSKEKPEPKVTSDHEPEGDSEGDMDEDGADKPNRPKRPRVECIMGDYTEEQLRNMHPQRTTVEF